MYIECNINLTVFPRDTDRLKSPPTVCVAVNSTADVIDYLGINRYHQERLAILVHMLANNTRIPFSPNTTQAWNIVRKVLPKTTEA